MTGRFPCGEGSGADLMTEPSIEVTTGLRLIAEEIGRCVGCDLCKTRTRAVPGEGSAESGVLFIGEAPGSQEDRLGRPFVGPAGAFLQELLQSIGLTREQIFITNTVKCRPPGNRDPLPHEALACSGYLARQIELLQPQVIVTLGRHSMARYFPGASISRIHGQAKHENGIHYFPSYHPAAALHQPALRQTLYDDFARIPALLALMVRKQQPEPEEPRQMTMF